MLVTLVALLLLPVMDEHAVTYTSVKVLMLLLSTLLFGLLCWRFYSKGLGHSYHFWHVLEALCTVGMFLTQCIAISSDQAIQSSDGELIGFMALPILLVCWSRTLRHTCHIVATTFYDAIPVYVLGVLIMSHACS